MEKYLAINIENFFLNLINITLAFKILAVNPIKKQKQENQPLYKKRGKNDRSKGISQPVASHSLYNDCVSVKS